jgi:hypothetical protein
MPARRRLARDLLELMRRVLAKGGVRWRGCRGRRRTPAGDWDGHPPVGHLVTVQLRAADPRQGSGAVHVPGASGTSNPAGWGNPTLGHGTSLQPLSPAFLESMDVVVCGYPGDKCGAQPYDATRKCSPLRLHAADTHKGQSGRPYGSGSGTTPGDSSECTQRRIGSGMPTQGGCRWSVTIGRYTSAPTWPR